MIGAIVLAFTALEAFVNETIPEDFIYVCDVKGEKEKKFDKTSIERYIPIDEKLATILPKILNCKSPKTFHCWGNYKKLKTTRDRLIHMKTEDRNYSSSKQDTVWKAVLIYPAPHQAAKAIIDHYANAMQTKPNWHLKFPIL